LFTDDFSSLTAVIIAVMQSILAAVRLSVDFHLTGSSDCNNANHTDCSNAIGSFSIYSYPKPMSPLNCILFYKQKSKNKKLENKLTINIGNLSIHV